MRSPLPPAVATAFSSHSIALTAPLVVLIEADEDAYQRLRTSGVDLVFNIAEGIRGEDREAQIPAMLEMLGIPYTGSGPLTLAICLHKGKTKEILGWHGIPTPAFQVVTRPEGLDLASLTFPLIVKLLHEGSSMGLSYDSVVETPVALAERITYLAHTYAQPVIVEHFIDGREFTVSVLGHTPPWALPVVEVLFSGPRSITLFQPDDAVIWLLARARGHSDTQRRHRTLRTGEYNLIAELKQLLRYEHPVETSSVAGGVVIDDRLCNCLYRAQSLQITLVFPLAATI